MTISDPAAPLQKAVVAALNAHTALNAIIASRIYDRVMPNPTFPYVSLGPVQVLPEHADEYDASDVHFQIDGWSRAVGTIEAKRIASCVREALDLQILVLEENHRMVGLDIVSTDYMTDQDGLTTHAILSFRARTEPTA